jgi:hypothetical protein
MSRLPCTTCRINTNIVLHNAVDDDVIASDEAAHTRTQIVTPSTHVWIPGQQPKALLDALHHRSGNIDAAALSRAM